MHLRLALARLVPPRPQAFFQTHVCNELCVRLGLPPPSRVLQALGSEGGQGEAR
jgi:hypothetical protein